MFSNRSSEYDNNSTNCSVQGVFINYPDSWEASKWIRCTEFIITFILNTTLIWLLQSKGKQSNLVYFVFHLAISDVAVAIFHILPLTIQHFVNDWVLGIVICKLKFYTSNISLYASTYLIVTISTDRLLSVKYPLGIFRKSHTYRRILVLIPWILSCALSVPTLLWTTFMEGFCGRGICSPDIRGVREIAVFMNASFLLFIPSSLLITCYTMIAICLFKETKATNMVVYNNVANDLKTQNHHSALRSRAKRKNAVMTFVVSLTFIGCWLPSILAVILNLYGRFGYGGWFDILTALAPLNSLLNPIIFVAFNGRTIRTHTTKRFNPSGSSGRT